MVADGSVFMTLPSPEYRGVRWEFCHCGLLKSKEIHSKSECRSLRE